MDLKVCNYKVSTTNNMTLLNYFWRTLYTCIIMYLAVWSLHFLCRIRPTTMAQFWLSSYAYFYVYFKMLVHQREETLVQCHSTVPVTHTHKLNMNCNSFFVCLQLVLYLSLTVWNSYNFIRCLFFFFLWLPTIHYKLRTIHFFMNLLASCQMLFRRVANVEMSRKKRRNMKEKGTKSDALEKVKSFGLFIKRFWSIIMIWNKMNGTIKRKKRKWKGTKIKREKEERVRKSMKLKRETKSTHTHMGNAQLQNANLHFRKRTETARKREINNDFIKDNQICCFNM